MAWRGRRRHSKITSEMNHCPNKETLKFSHQQRKIIHATPEKIHVNTKFTALVPTTLSLGRMNRFYILTSESGHWRVKMRSIFAQ